MNRWRGRHGERLMRPLGVVALDPGVELGLGDLRSGKIRPVRNSERSVRWNRWILPVVVGLRGAVNR